MGLFHYYKLQNYLLFKYCHFCILSHLLCCNHSYQFSNVLLIHFLCYVHPQCVSLDLKFYLLCIFFHIYNIDTFHMWLNAIPDFQSYLLPNHTGHIIICLSAAFHYALPCLLHFDKQNHILNN